MEWKDEEERERERERFEEKGGQRRREGELLRASTGQLIFYKSGLERS